jgi:hypothetical protein
MLNHHSDQLPCAPRFQRTHRGLYAEVPAQSLDEQSRLLVQLIDLAFDILDARHLEVRVAGQMCKGAAPCPQPR